MPIKEKWQARAKKLKADIPAIFLALRKKETPWYAKCTAALAVAYALSPVDLIPDFIPLLGYLDDLLLLPAMVALTIRFIPNQVLDACREEAISMWRDGKPKKWYFAIPILLFWALLVWLVVKTIVF